MLGTYIVNPRHGCCGEARTQQRSEVVMGYEWFRRSAEQNAIARWCRSVRVRDVILATLFVALVAS